MLLFDVCRGGIAFCCCSFLVPAISSPGPGWLSTQGLIKMAANRARGVGDHWNIAASPSFHFSIQNQQSEFIPHTVPWLCISPYVKWPTRNRNRPLPKGVSKSTPIVVMGGLPWKPIPVYVYYGTRRALLNHGLSEKHLSRLILRALGYRLSYMSLANWRWRSRPAGRCLKDWHESESQSWRGHPRLHRRICPGQTTRLINDNSAARIHYNLVIMAHRHPHPDANPFRLSLKYSIQNFFKPESLQKKLEPYSRPLNRQNTHNYHWHQLTEIPHSSEDVRKANAYSYRILNGPRNFLRMNTTWGSCMTYLSIELIAPAVRRLLHQPLHPRIRSRYYSSTDVQRSASRPSSTLLLPCSACFSGRGHIYRGGRKGIFGACGAQKVRMQAREI